METLLVLGALLYAAFSFWNRSPTAKGRRGERKTQRAVRRGLDERVYHSFHDLILPTISGTTQVDHVIVSRFGIFVVESKNMTGWIFGDPSARHWTQVLYKKKFQFQNPLRQNYKHVKAIEDLLNVRPNCIHSVVVFAGDSVFKTPMPENVVGIRRFISHITSKTDVLLQGDDVEAAIIKLRAVDPPDRALRKKHLSSLRENQRQPACPRCGSMMVLRAARNGPRQGAEFWGCSDFPRCKATRSLR